MQVSAKTKFVKTSPKKVRLVVDVVRGMETARAIDILRLMNKKSAMPVMKLINTAIANAEHNFELAKDNLYIKEIRVDEAPTLKRWMPRAHGRATTIRKRNSHINLVLAEIKDTGEKVGKKQVVEKPVKLGDMNKQESASSSTPAKTTVDKKEVKKEIGKDKDVFDEGIKDASKEIIDPRRESRGGHGNAEGGKKGFASKIFRRKSG